MKEQAIRAISARYPGDDIGDARLVGNFKSIEKYEVREIPEGAYRGPAIP